MDATRREPSHDEPTLAVTSTPDAGAPQGPDEQWERHERRMTFLHGAFAGSVLAVFVGLCLPWKIGAILSAGIALLGVRIALDPVLGRDRFRAAKAWTAPVVGVVLSSASIWAATHGYPNGIPVASGLRMLTGAVAHVMESLSNGVRS